MRCSAFNRQGLRFSFFVLLLFTLQLFAQYGGVPLQNIPIERLIRNLEEMVSKEPKNADLRLNLARAHAMAYAHKMRPADEAEVLSVSQGPYFGPTARPVPFTPKPTNDPELMKLAKAHLDQAIELYRQTIELDPDDLIAKLGYAWCLDQSGDRNKAITAYRRIVADAWAGEQEAIRRTETGEWRRPARPMRFDESFITVEAIGYLIPLLDREKDRDEIATLNDRVRMFNAALGRGVTPIVIPLRDDVEPESLVDNTARVAFDADGSGLPKRWTWITPEAGWLVHAPRGAARIDSALQLFGSVTFWMFWENGYQALAALDDNHDGMLRGGELQDLAVWQDANRNGIAEDGEVRTLADWNIVTVNCAFEMPEPNASPDYVAFSKKGVVFNNGHSRPTYDVVLRSSGVSGKTTE